MRDLHSLSNSWCTPDWLFEELNKEFNFDIDLCAEETNSKCTHWCRDYLDPDIMKIFLEFGIESAFMNPPYSNPKPFIEKAWEDSKYCKIVCLVKCDPSTRWWAVFWDYEDILWDEYNSTIPSLRGMTKKSRGPKPGCEVRFFPKRIKFDPPNCRKCGNLRIYGPNASPCPHCLSGKSGPTFPCALVIMDRREV